MAIFRSYIFIVFILLALLLVSAASTSMYGSRFGHRMVAGKFSDSLSINSDTLSLNKAKLSNEATDSLTVDSVMTADSLSRPKKKTELDAPVAYESKDSVIFELDSISLAHLYGEGKVDYVTLELQADIISMNMDSNTVYAVGRPDSTGKARIGDPVFKDGDTSYQSENMHYNFKTKKAFTKNISTQQGEGFVASTSSKKDSLDNLYMKGGRYTTCDNKDHPHFYLALTRGKVKPKKNVVFGPAYLVVEDVPLPLAIPFGFFPFNSSYSSGFIMPSYGDELERGFYLSDGGYYWAISDYMDLKLTGQIFTKGSWGLDARSNYNRRYKYSGSVNASYLYTKTGEKNMPDYSTSRDFRLQWGHRQDAKFRPNSSFAASVNFSTSSYEHSSLNSFYNPALFSQNTKTSSINYTRSFPDQKLTISTGLNLSQTSSDSSVSVSFPNLSVSMLSIYPFKRKKKAGDERWYEKIHFNYSGQLANSITTKEDKLLHSNLIKDWRNGVKHEIPISATFTLFNYLNISPSFDYTERWYSYKVNESRESANREVLRDTVYGFNRVYNYSASLAFSTKLYGMYTPVRAILGDKVRQIRHVFTPTVTFSAAPDFGSRSYGYYKTYNYIDAYGEEQTVEYSPYAGQLYGVPSKGKTGSVSFNVSNNLEMKIKSRRDSTGIKKISLIDELGMGLSYNMAAQSRPWSDLSMRLRLKFSKSYTFNLSTSFATYAYQFNDRGEVYVGDRTEWSYGRFGRFSGTSFSYAYTFNNGTWKKWFGKKGESSNAKSAVKPVQDEATTEETSNSSKEQKAEVDADGYEKFSIPWSFSVSYSCRISENTSAQINPETMRYPYRLNHTLSGSGNIKISNNWDFSFSTAYDFDAHELATTTCNISRDLHCFTMTCSFTPFGRWKSYNFVIRAKSTLLQDLKWEQRSPYNNNVQWY